jgi:ABC-type nitrate/sulfonate/bicarbonate transport system substrate-binding protein
VAAGEPVRLVPRRSPAGVQSMFQFFTGAIDVAYVGLTPFLLARSYGLPVRVVGIAQECARGHAVVLRQPSVLNGDGDVRIGTVLASNGHQVAAAWATRIDQHVTFVDLSPAQQVEALRHGLIDGMSAWEPHTTAALRLGAHRVFDADDVGAPSFNVVCASDEAIEAKGQQIRSFLSAHHEAVAIIDHGPVEEHLDVLQSVFDTAVDAGDARSMLRDSYRWPVDHLTEGIATDAVVGALSATRDFLAETGLLGRGPIDLAACFAPSLETATTDAEALVVGYSDSFVCAPFHLAQGMGLFEARGFRIDSERQRLVERINGLERRLRDELRLVDGYLRQDPRTAVMKLGMLNEDLFTGIYREVYGQPAPERLSKTLEVLEDDDVVPAGVLACAHWIRSVRNIATHRGGVSSADAANCHRFLVDVLEWHASTRAHGLRRAVRCRRCKKDLDAGWNVCPFCSLPVRDSCAGCGQDLQSGWKACPHCGVAAA